ncbi:MAG: zinc ribbon domain-containing protein, partial [Chloroflexota bacterium]
MAQGRRWKHEAAPDRIALPCDRILAIMVPYFLIDGSAMPDRTKPLPQPTPETARFWEGTRQHELWMQRCGDCAQFYFYPRAFCRFCGGGNV